MTPVVPTDTLAVVPFTAEFDAAVAEALTARPELQLLRTQERVRSLLVDVAAADAKPSVEFNGSLRVCRAPARKPLQSGLLALVRRHQSHVCRSSTAGARRAAWRRRPPSAIP